MFIKRIASSYLSLLLLNILASAAAMLLISYYIKIFGDDLYSEYVLANAVLGLLSVLADFGISTTAVSQIKNSEMSLMSKLTWNLLYAKLLISGFCFVIGCVMVFILLKNKLFGIVFMLGLFGYAQFPVWYYQVKEEFGLMNLMQIFGRLLGIALPFVLVTNRSDFMLAAVINFMVGFLLSLSGFYFIYRSHRPSSFDGVIFLRQIENYSFGFSGLFSSLIRNANVLVVQIFSNSTQIVCYNVSEKIAQGVQSVLNPFSTALYPHLINRNYEVKKIVIGFVIFLAMICLFVVFSSKWLVGYFVAANRVEMSASFLVIFMASTFIGCLNFMLANFKYYAYGDFSRYARFLMIANVVGVISSVVAGFFVGTLGCVVAVVITELVLIIALLRGRK